MRAAYHDAVLSIVIPTYGNRALTLSSMATLDAFLARRAPDAEVVLVDDGSRPAQRTRPEELPARVTLVQLPENRGKGFAVRTGMSRARGAVRLFTDVDLPFDLEAIPYARSLVEQGFHAVFGDRTLRDSCATVELPVVRRAASWTFTKLVSLFVVSGVADTQCGFKAFSGRLASALFPLLTIDRFAMDVELYYVLLKHDVLIRRIPVRLRNVADSTVVPALDGAEMVRALLRLPLNHRRGLYRSPALEALQEERYWLASAPERLEERPGVGPLDGVLDPARERGPR
jgi:dolichyl-phosphate beta-glucosyltransferase